MRNVTLNQLRTWVLIPLLIFGNSLQQSTLLSFVPQRRCCIYHRTSCANKPTRNSHTSLSAEISVSGAKPRYYAAMALIPRQGSVAFALDRLENSLQQEDMSARDRAFARLLVTTAERRLGQVDAVLSHFQRGKYVVTSSAQKRPRKTNQIDQFVESVVRVGAVQLLFLGIPHHAAVKETVDVLRLSKGISVSEAKIKYVNAVLRRLSREGLNVLSNVTDITANASPWLINEFRQTWGDEATHRILSAAMEETPRSLTVNRNRMNFEGTNGLFDSVSVHEQIQKVAELFEHAEILPQGSIQVLDPPSGPLTSWPLYKEGLWWCQDPSATIPALALYQAVSRSGTVPVRNMHVIDMCAAPGGKTAQLSNFGFATVTAVEVSMKRYGRLLENMTRLRMEWNIVIADGRDWKPTQLVDAVLLDVPCTATGTGSKRPDVLRRDSNITELLNIQQELAQHVASSMLKIGGILVYATCSLLKQEGEDQVSKLLRRMDGTVVLQTVPFQKGDIPGFDEAIDAHGWIRVLPGALSGRLSQVDGFFVARLQRIS
jgi:16S rRNA (cytosine967-C5)-methyltransferase